ncbi:hypothetical protein [Campylobacter sp. 2457A]|uniref:hypothetical protein n=2 Tax=unclassified Campylobacter TaxID=2593542 RepID=UPI00301D8227
MKKIICFLVMIFCTLNADNIKEYDMKDDIFYYLGKRTFGVFGCLDQFNYLPINFSLIQDKYYSDNLTKNLITNLNTLKDNDYKAFGVELPKNVILEVFEFGEKHKDKFSNLVKQYPFVQLVFSQWLTIKLYEKQKELTNNPNLDYEEFLKNFTSTFNHKSYNLLDAIHQLKVENINHKDDEFFNIIDTATALGVWGRIDHLYINDITLYDIIYDIIPNSIRKVFLKDEKLLKTYLPLNQDQFYYKEYEYEDPKNTFKYLYGENVTYNEKKVPKKYYQMDALYLKDYNINPLISKAKINKLGIGYDELLELMQNDQTSLKYPEIDEFKVIDETKHSEEYGWEFLYKVVLDPKKRHKANYEDMVRLSQTQNEYGYTPRHGETLADDKVYAIIIKQYYNARVFLIQNNFHSQNLIFESFRMKLREDEDFKRQIKENTIFTEFGETIGPKAYDWIVQSDAFLAYRFNQALALAFLNAYDKTKVNIEE